MNTYFRKSLVLILLILAAALAAAADVKYSMEMGTSAAQGMAAPAFTVYVKGQQERRDMNMMGMNVSTITDCERRQVLTVNWKCKLYLTAPLDPERESTMPAMGPGAQRAEPERKGGVVVVENEFRDTGERKTLFGLPARHIVMHTKMEAKEGSCNPGHTEMENDMWLVDVQAQLACRPKPGEGRPAFAPVRGGCRDDFQAKTSGSASLMRGLPVISKMTTVTASGQRQTFTMEIKDLYVATLEPSLFEPPSGFQEAKSQQELYTCGMGMAGMADARRQAQAARRSSEAAPAEEAAAAPRRGGEWLVGVVLTDRSGRLDAAPLTERLVEDIKAIPGFDAVPIDARTPPEIQREATEKKCTFLLYADMRDVKSSGGGVGGLLGRRAGLGGLGEAKHNIRMDYRLTTVPPPEDEIAKETLNHSSSDVSSERPKLEDVATSFMQKTAERATDDARQWKEREKK